MTVQIKQRQATHPAADFPEAMHPVLQRVYANRGITAADELEHELKALLPFHDLLQVDKAVSLLSQVLQQHKRIMIVGDYDADGATSTALMVRALRALGAKHVDFLVPNRFEYGYGLTPEIVALAETRKADCLITVDNGIVSFEGVDAAKACGMQVIITDHHLAADTLPNADAIVNPNQPNDPFPSKHLAGVGVSFYVMLALRAELKNIGWFEQQNINMPNMAQFLDIVALGTVADVVTLDKNNRILVEQGLQRIRAGKCCEGIRALISIAKRDCRKIVASDLGFIVAPRLNAAGRLDDMSLGVQCLTSNKSVEARLYATQLDQLNQERKQLESDMRHQALSSLKQLHLNKDNLPMSLCLYDASWHQGVIGILAARVKELYHRPVIAFAKTSETDIKGSARSIPGLHLRDVLESIATQHPGLIDKYGGHAMAAGLSIQLSQFEAFKAAFETAVTNQVTEDTLKHVILTDGILNTEDLTLELAGLLKTAGPWGQNFPEPLFEGEFQLLDQRLVGEKHLKMSVALPEDGLAIDAIAFNIDLSRWPNHRCGKVHLVYQLDINEFRGAKQLQLIVRHITDIRSHACVS